MLRGFLQACYFMFLIGFLFVVLPSVSAQTKHPKTIKVLKDAYIGEVKAHHTYIAYAQKANSEGYPNIAKLFMSLSTSEAIHARNFKDILSALNMEVNDISNPELKVSSTKKNLKNATKVELHEIDNKYPQFIQMIESENHQEAIRSISYAWESEKQHRDLIQKIQSGTGIFFGLLTKKIEGAPAYYYVCQKCGSTLTELPADHCPVCKDAVSHYIKLK
jgi:rubrerythrin